MSVPAPITIQPVWPQALPPGRDLGEGRQLRPWPGEEQPGAHHEDERSQGYGEGADQGIPLDGQQKLQTDNAQSHAQRCDPPPGLVVHATKTLNRKGERRQQQRAEQDQQTGQYGSPPIPRPSAFPATAEVR
jgi:hypothetical protein